MSSTMLYHPFGSSSSSNAKNKPNIITPRIIEKELGESMKHRTALLPQYKDLGQPDLVHISKYDKGTKQEIGEYHYSIGIDTSSSVQAFMYLQTIQLNDKHEATIKHPKIGTYSSYNIFTKGDLRIRCNFPSTASPTIQFYPSTPGKLPFNLSEGKDDEKSKQIWLETSVSCLIRSILLSDDIRRQLPGMCKYNLFQSTKDAKAAIKSLVKFLPKGASVGCDDIYNHPTVANNLLVDALLKLVTITHYYDLAIEEIKNMSIDPKFNVLIVRILIMKGDYAKAIQLMHTHFNVSPRDGWMLNEQVELLLKKGRADLAFLPSMRCIESLPTEFKPWQNLIKVHILKKDFKNALLALNSSPMYVNRKKDVFPALTPREFDFPEPLEGKIESVWASSDKFGCISGVGGIVEFSDAEEIRKVYSEDLQVYEETKLNATFLEAYNLLGIMSKQIGWIELLKLRSNTFVMEDEYNEGQEEESETFKSKRLSEKWLDSLFIIFYSNLKRVLIWRNEIDASKINKKELTIQPLQWELIGEEYYKAHYFKEGLFPLTKALESRFSIFAATRILRYFLDTEKNWEEFKELHLVNDNDVRLPEEYVLNVCLDTISWNFKYYGEFPVICIEVLRQLLDAEMLELDSLKARDVPVGMASVVERLVGWLSQFEG